MRTPLTTLALLLAAATAVAAEAPTVLATADGEGALRTCADCPLKLGGIAKRATLLAREKKAAGAALLVDAGNSLFGAETAESKGKVAAELFDRLGYDVLNLGWRDFRFGLAATRAAVADRSFAAVSANLHDARTGERLFPASTVVERGGRRILVVGATRRPPEAGAFPWIDRQLAGVEVRAPAEDVKAALDAAADADSRILLWYGSPAALRLALGKELSRFDAVVVGGARPSELPAGGEPAMAATLTRGRSVARISLGEGPRAEEPRLVDPEIADDPDVAAVVRRSLAAEEPGPPPLPEGELGEVPADIGSARGKHVHVRAEAEDRAFGVLVLGLDVEDYWQGVRAGRGRRLLVADVSVENRIAPDVVIDGGLPEVMQVAETRRQFFLLVNGRRVVPVAPGALEQEGALPASFVLRPGDAADGKLAFAVPDTEIRSLELRFYPDGFAPVIVRLKEGDLAREEPVVGPKENGDLSLSVAGFELVDEFRGRHADDGKQFAVVHLRGSSRLAMEMPAIAVREDAKPGETARVGQVFEYKRAELLVRLVVDGLWAYAADPLSEPEATTPMFLPDVTAGFPLAFVVPADAKTFRLDCDFPQMKLSTERELRIPAAIVFPLRGEAAAGPRKAVAVADDPPLRVAVLDVREADEFAGRKSGDAERFVVVDVAFRNGAPEGAALDPYDRFHLVWGEKKPARGDYATKLGPRPAAGSAFLPPGRARAFEIVWKVPRDVGSVELRWSGVGRNASFPLELGAESPREETLDGDTPSATASGGAGPESAPEPVVPAKREPKGLEGFGIDGAEVNRAIKRGREFLWQYIQEEDLAKNRRFGDRREHILAALALLHADALSEFPDLDGPLRELMARARLGGTYEKSLYLMLVRAYGDPTFYPRAAEVAASIVNDQGPEGSWSYGTGIPAVSPEKKEEPKAADAEPARRDGPFAVTGGEAEAAPEEPAAPAFEPHEIERTVPWEEGKNGDNSCSQFAVLGLRSAAGFGVRAPRRTWERALASFSQRQGKDGAWGYGAYGAYGSMTCAGLCSLALARDALGEEHPTEASELRAGMRWLADHFTTGHNPGKNDWNYYYIYSVERVGRILDTEFVGPFEWYPMGVRTLLSRQGKDGSWVGGSKERDPRIATSFALLFLTRATEKLRPEPEEAGPRPGADRPEEPGRLVTDVAKSPDRTWYFILDCSGSMRAPVGGEEKFEVARGALREIVEGLPDGSRVALRAYGHRYFAIDEKANEDSELLVPPGPLDRASFEATLSRLKPKGKTPLAFSLKQAARDVRGSTTVILLTDGGEDTIPRGDPVAAARGLGGRDGVRLRVVGLDIGRPAWTKQLRGMADAAGGTYTPAGDRRELLDVLRASAGGAPSGFTVVDADGKKIAEGEFGDTVPLPVGRYRLRTTLGGKPVETAFAVSSGATVRIRWDPKEGR